MSFREFDLPRVQRDFGIQLRMTQALFPQVRPVPISEELAAFWKRVLPLGLGQITEKARSELLTAPLLAEVWYRSDKQVVMLSGVEWSVDDKAGLNGVADFLLCRSPLMLYVSAPVLVAVEAKRDSIPEGLGQCAAEMVGAQRFNQEAGAPIDPIYGCVTTGSNWRFLRLSGTQLDIDLDEYAISQPDRILGVLLYCCGVTV
jgi:hypothetical protein